MLIGESEALQEIRTTIDQLHNYSKTPVLITGESGVGKELVAQAIHFGGPRASESFVAVNCSAVPSTLSESAFFGHIRGAFTGAMTSRKGYFESADGGTLFFDEIGDMPIESQTKLLRVLDDGVITPIGATTSRRVDFRVIAATNADILAKAAAGLFRSDLYFRLAGMTIWIPPLRERKEDILPISEYHLSEFAAQMEVPPPPLTPEAKAALEEYPFPGNVRELKHVIEFAIMMSDGAAIQPRHLRFPSAHTNVLPSSVTTSDDTVLPLEEALERYEREYLGQVLERTGGNRAEAARLLGIPRRTLYRKLAKYNL